MKSNEVLISTTSSVEPGRIEAFFGLISAHSMTLVETSSVAKSRSGAHCAEALSKCLSPKLSRARNDALTKLKSTANDLGANCVLATRVDHELLSFEKHSVLIVTATGTAALADFVIRSSNARIPAQDVDMALRNSRIERHAAGGLLSDEDWEFIIANPSPEFAGKALNLLIDVMKSGDSKAQASTVTHAKQYFARLPRSEAAKTLHSALHYGLPDPAASTLVDVIGELGLVNFGELLDLIQSDDRDVRMRGVHLLAYDRDVYSQQDLPVMKAVLREVATLKPVVQTFSRTKKLSSIVEELWGCECGGEVDIAVANCPACGRDVWGFPRDRINPPEAQQRLEEIITAVEDLLRLRSAA